MHSFLSFPRATIKSEGHLRAARNSFLPPSVVSFFSLPSFLGFFNRDEAARLASRQPSIRYFGCSLLQRGSRNPRRDIHRLAHLLLYSRPKERARYVSFARANIIFSRRERFVSRLRKTSKIPHSFSPSLTYNCFRTLSELSRTSDEKCNTNNAKVQGCI